ncbi:MAG: Cof-type HAD-IIB family hydrolase [Clostridiales bacterium]|nr:Cof-type HAD-IIB family hydrolase [Clostridiales bacterium]
MNTDIRLIALDLDGTLLDSEKNLSQANREALRMCAERGIEIVPCTGRIWQGIPEFIRELPGVRYAITVNGAVIRDIQKDQTLAEHKMSCETAAALMELAQQFHVMYDCYIDGQGYGESRFMDHMDDYGTPLTLQGMIRKTRRPTPNLLEMVRRKADPVEKVNYFFDNQEELVRARVALSKRDDIVVSSSFSNNLEINGTGATKGNGILCLAEHVGIDPSQTMGFGDGENDLSMMKLSGIGVAMANAVESVKMAADYVTLTNDEDGVAAALRKLILNA